MSAMQAVPRGMAATIPTSQKYDHVTAMDTIRMATGEALNAGPAYSFLIDPTTPYSPLLLGAPTFVSQGGSRNATFSASMRDLYNKCVVLNSEIRVDFFHLGSTGSGADNLFVGITPLSIRDIDHGAIAIANGSWDRNWPQANYALEKYGTVYTSLRPGQTKTLITSMNPHKFMGRTDPLGDDEYHVFSQDNGQTAADNCRCYWAVWAANIAGTSMTNIALCDAVVTERKTIVWFEPKEHTRTNN